MSATATTTRHYLSPDELRELPAGTIVTREALEEVWEKRDGWSVNTGRKVAVERQLRLGRRNPKNRAAEALNADGSVAWGCGLPYVNAGYYYLVD